MEENLQTIESEEDEEEEGENVVICRANDFFEMIALFTFHSHSKLFSIYHCITDTISNSV